MLRKSERLANRGPIRLDSRRRKAASQVVSSCGSPTASKSPNPEFADCRVPAGLPCTNRAAVYPGNPESGRPHESKLPSQVRLTSDRPSSQNIHQRQSMHLPCWLSNSFLYAKTLSHGSRARWWYRRPTMAHRTVSPSVRSKQEPNRKEKGKSRALRVGLEPVSNRPLPKNSVLDQLYYQQSGGFAEVNKYVDRQKEVKISLVGLLTANWSSRDGPSRR